MISALPVSGAWHPKMIGAQDERPFYGLPDDPGVKEGAAAKRDGTSGFRLF